MCWSTECVCAWTELVEWCARIHRHVWNWITISIDWVAVTLQLFTYRQKINKLCLLSSTKFCAPFFRLPFYPVMYPVDVRIYCNPAKKRISINLLINRKVAHRLSSRNGWKTKTRKQINTSKSKHRTLQILYTSVCSVLVSFCVHIQNTKCRLVAVAAKMQSEGLEYYILSTEPCNMNTCMATVSPERTTQSREEKKRNEKRAEKIRSDYPN